MLSRRPAAFFLVFIGAFLAITYLYPYGIANAADLKCSEKKAYDTQCDKDQIGRNGKPTGLKGGLNCKCQETDEVSKKTIVGKCNAKVQCIGNKKETKDAEGRPVQTCLEAGNCKPGQTTAPKQDGGTPPGVPSPPGGSSGSGSGSGGSSKTSDVPKPDKTEEQKRLEDSLSTLEKKSVDPIPDTNSSNPAEVPAAPRTESLIDRAFNPQPVDIPSGQTRGFQPPNTFSDQIQSIISNPGGSDGMDRGVDTQIQTSPQTQSSFVTGFQQNEFAAGLEPSGTDTIVGGNTRSDLPIVQASYKSDLGIAGPNAGDWTKWPEVAADAAPTSVPAGNSTSGSGPTSIKVDGIAGEGTLSTQTGYKDGGRAVYVSDQFGNVYPMDANAANSGGTTLRDVAQSDGTGNSPTNPLPLEKIGSAEEFTVSAAQKTASGSAIPYTAPDPSNPNSSGSYQVPVTDSPVKNLAQLNQNGAPGYEIGMVDNGKFSPSTRGTESFLFSEPKATSPANTAQNAGSGDFEPPPKLSNTIFDSMPATRDWAGTHNPSADSIYGSQSNNANPGMTTGGQGVGQESPSFQDEAKGLPLPSENLNGKWIEQLPPGATGGDTNLSPNGTGPKADIGIPKSASEETGIKLGQPETNEPVVTRPGPGAPSTRSPASTPEGSSNQGGSGDANNAPNGEPTGIPGTNDKPNPDGLNDVTGAEKASPNISETPFKNGLPDASGQVVPESTKGAPTPGTHESNTQLPGHWNPEAGDVSPPENLNQEGRPSANPNNPNVVEGTQTPTNGEGNQPGGENAQKPGTTGKPSSEPGPSGSGQNGGSGEGASPDKTPGPGDPSGSAKPAPGGNRQDPSGAPQTAKAPSVAESPDGSTAQPSKGGQTVPDAKGDGSNANPSTSGKTPLPSNTPTNSSVPKILQNIPYFSDAIGKILGGLFSTNNAAPSAPTMPSSEGTTNVPAQNNPSNPGSNPPVTPPVNSQTPPANTLPKDIPPGECPGGNCTVTNPSAPASVQPKPVGNDSANIPLTSKVTPRPATEQPKPQDNVVDATFDANQQGVTAETPTNPWQNILNNKPLVQPIVQVSNRTDTPPSLSRDEIETLKRQVTEVKQGLDTFRNNLETKKEGTAEENKSIEKGLLQAEKMGKTLGGDLGGKILNYVQQARALGPQYSQYQKCQNPVCTISKGLDLKAASDKVLSDGRALTLTSAFIIGSLKPTEPQATAPVTTNTKAPDAPPTVAQKPAPPKTETPPANEKPTSKVEGQSPPSPPQTPATPPKNASILPPKNAPNIPGQFNPASGAQLVNSVNSVCKAVGCNARVMSEALSGIASIESGGHAQIPHPGSPYQGYGQLGSDETNRATAKLAEIAQSSRLSPEEQSAMRDVAARARAMIDAGQNPNTDSHLGPWLLTGLHAAQGTMNIVSAMTDDPRLAAAYMMHAQLAPATFKGGFSADKILIPAAVAAYNKQGWAFVPQGANVAYAAQQVLQAKGEQIDKGIDFMRRLADGDSYVPYTGAPVVACSYKGCATAPTIEPGKDGRTPGIQRAASCEGSAMCAQSAHTGAVYTSTSIPSEKFTRAVREEEAMERLAQNGKLPDGAQFKNFKAELSNGVVANPLTAIAKAGGHPVIPGAKVDSWYPMNDPGKAPRRDGIISHQSAGRWGSGLNTARAQTFNGLHSQGTEWWVLADGTILHTRPEVTTGHIGINKPPDAQHLLNDNTVGIEFEGHIGQRLSPQQIEAGKQLMQYLQERYDLSSNQIFKHGKTGPSSAPAAEGAEMEKIAREMKYVPGTGVPTYTITDESGAKVAENVPLQPNAVSPDGTTRMLSGADGKPLGADGKSITDGTAPLLASSDATLPKASPNAQDPNKLDIQDERPDKPVEKRPGFRAPNNRDWTQSDYSTSRPTSTCVANDGSLYACTPTGGSQPTGGTQPTGGSQPTGGAQSSGGSTAAQPPYQRPNPTSSQVPPITNPIILPPLTPALICSPPTVAFGTTTPVTVSWSCLTGSASSTGFATGGAPSGRITQTSSSRSTSTIRFLLQCVLGTQASPVAACNIPVSVPPPPTVTLHADPTSLDAGSSAILIWGSGHATRCSLKATSTAELTDGSIDGSTSTAPLFMTTPFTATCINAAGATSSSTITVRVQ